MFSIGRILQKHLFLLFCIYYQIAQFCSIIKQKNEKWFKIKLNKFVQLNNKN